MASDFGSRVCRPKSVALQQHSSYGTLLAVSVGNIVRVSGLSSELLSRIVHPL